MSWESQLCKVNQACLKVQAAKVTDAFWTPVFSMLTILQGNRILLWTDPWTEHSSTQQTEAFLPRRPYSGWEHTHRESLDKPVLAAGPSHDSAVTGHEAPGPHILLCFHWNQSQGSTLRISAVIFNITTKPEKEARPSEKCCKTFLANFIWDFLN